jgi:hypothetical protein
VIAMGRINVPRRLAGRCVAGELQIFGIGQRAGRNAACCTGLAGGCHDDEAGDAA